MTEAVASPPVTETPFSRNRERYKELVKIIVNESGSYSLDDQLKAWSAQEEMGVKGHLMTGDFKEQEESGRLDDILLNSELYRRMVDISNRSFAAMSSVPARGYDAALASLRDLASLSEDDQKISYTLSNGFDLAGNRHYASFDSFRDQQVKNAQRAVAYRGNDPALAQALATIGSAKSGSEWSSQVLSLFKPLEAEDRVPSQSPAQRLFDVRPSVPSSYEPGNLRVKLV
ncbi:MAG: hypothetical protein INF04_12810 [Phenylobacterium sp.]|nr:hypothetical protein [Phenylobacterium sp.]MCA6229276.1 hypothetical protein [Phenylobacterium sp.]